MLLLATILTGSGCSNSDNGYRSNDDENNNDLHDAGDDPDTVAGRGGSGGEAGGGGDAASAGQNESGSGGQTEDAGSDPIQAFGFSIRVPRYHTVSCESEMGPAESVEELERDFICTFDYTDESGHLYFKSKPSGCQFLMGPSVSFELEGAQLALGDEIIDLQNAYYDLGGNHVNDSFGFDYKGKYLKYYHSSFGFGWRACQPMDCIQVFDTSEQPDPSLDGCTAERTLPIVCAQVQEDGSFDQLEDTFAPCPGDSNYE